jgi:hypothetical protein
MSVEKIYYVLKRIVHSYVLKYDIMCFSRFWILEIYKDFIWYATTKENFNIRFIFQQELFVQVHEWIMGDYKLCKWIILVYHHCLSHTWFMQQQHWWINTIQMNLFQAFFSWQLVFCFEKWHILTINFHIFW